MSRQSMPVKERVKDSMYALGMPITQGAITTIVGVIGLVLAPSYIFNTFFKMVLLVIVLGALHGLILLPVLLSFLGPGTYCCGAAASGAQDQVKKKKPAKQQKHQQVAGTQTYLDEAVDVVSMRIPRPKHCSRHQNGHSEGAGKNPQDSNMADENPQTNNGALFHSDNYLQAATKNKKRSRDHTNSQNNHRSRSSSQHRTSRTTPPPPNQTKNGIYEMYTNRAFQD